MLVLALQARRAAAQVSDEANCGTSLPACTALRTNCCTRTFTSTATQKAILIPTDRCHQPFVNAVAQGGPDVSANAPQWCQSDPTPASNSQTYLYGLVYRLMQNKIPVYWIVNPTKAPTTYGGITPSSTAASTKDVDFWILTAAGTPPAPTAPLTAGAGVVTRLNITNRGMPTLSYTVAATYGHNEFPIRGGAFLIAPEDRAAFDNFMKSNLGRTTCGSGNDCYDFFSPNGVYLWEIQPGAKLVWQDYTQPLAAGRYVENTGEIPVAMRIDYAPPKVAVVAGTTQMSAILAQANLDDLENTASCKAGTFTVGKAVGCVLTETDVVTNNRLVTTSFDNVWVDLASPTSCGPFNTKLQTFATSIAGTQTGGNIIMFGDSIAVAEQCATNRGALLGLAGTGLAMFGSTVNESNPQPFIIRYPANLLSQFGDLPLNFASGSVKAWDRVTAATDLYSTTYTASTTGNTLRRLMTQEQGGAGTNCTNHDDTGTVGAVSAAGCDDLSNNTTTGDYRDIYAYGRYLNNKRNGVVFYSPGNNPATNPTKSHMKLILGTLIAVPPFLVEQVFNNIEVTRSSPIVAAIGGTPSIVQGTYEYHFKTDGTDQYTVPRTIPTVFVPDDIANWSYPALIGHLRGTATSSVDTTVLALSAGTTTMHASTGEGAAATDTFPSVVYAGCAPPYTGTCRGVWTTTATGLAPAFQQVNEGNTAVSSLMLPETSFAATDPANGRTYRENFVRKILKGYDTGVGFVPMLGGIDRSTVAVIGPGASVGVGRATIAYVGSTDGMLHAICASTGPGCLRVGQELWAYIPRTNLPQLRYNLARVDSSPRVLDAKIGTGLKTVLLIQAGGDAETTGSTPAIYALDVSDPTNPSVLWEYATFDTASTGSPKTPSARPTNGLGLGMSLAAGQALIGGVTKNIVIAQTNNGGTGSNGNYIVAIDIATGDRIWERFNAYPSTSIATGFFAPRVQPTIDIPASGIPPGVVPVDKTLGGSNGFMTDIVAADLYGNLWLLNPADGTSRTKDTGLNEIPLFQFTSDYHPLTKPAIYTEGGVQFAVFSTGGYHDYTTAPQWGFNSPTQYLIAVNLNSTTVTAPLNETSGATDVPINQTLTGFGFSQARVVNQEIFVTTDDGNINLATFGSSTADTGHVLGYNIATNTAITTILQTRTGASSIANDGTDLFSSSGAGRQQLASASGEYDSSGVAGERTTAPNEVTSMLRKLWLRTE